MAHKIKKEKVPSRNSPTEDEFRNDIYPERTPLLMRGLDIGICQEKWTLDYLGEVGGQREVKIHVCSSPQMDFIHKNFAYKSLAFEEFARRVSKTKQDNFFFTEDEKYYLRSLGDNPRKDVADIRKEFPALADDIIFPPFFDSHKFFSSVFRISSQNVQLWTHYDIMDNMLIVVSGRKRVVLYEPSDALHLYLNGDKSEVLDIDNPDLDRYPEVVKATRYECEMEAGDILFIPAMWFHNVINLEAGVAVNVFWKHLENSFYDTKDTYGNKDLVPASRAMQVLDRSLKILDELPQEYKDFYARRMINKIQLKLSSKDCDDKS